MAYETALVVGPATTPVATREAGDATAPAGSAAASAKPSGSGARMLELDVLRGIAATVVVLGHYIKHYPQVYRVEPLGVPRVVERLLDGHSAVQLFFVISGFVIFMTLQRCRTVADFAWSRFARLFPTYWSAVTLTILTFLALGAPPNKQGLGLGTYLANLTMLNAWADSRLTGSTGLSRPS